VDLAPTRATVPVPSALAQDLENLGLEVAPTATGWLGASWEALLVVQARSPEDTEKVLDLTSQHAAPGFHVFGGGEGETLEDLVDPLFRYRVSRLELAPVLQPGAEALGRAILCAARALVEQPELAESVVATQLAATHAFQPYASSFLATLPLGALVPGAPEDPARCLVFGAWSDRARRQLRYAEEDLGERIEARMIARLSGLASATAPEDPARLGMQVWALRDLLGALEETVDLATGRRLLEEVARDLPRAPKRFRTRQYQGLVVSLETLERRVPEAAPLLGPEALRSLVEAGAYLDTEDPSEDQKIRRAVDALRARLADQG